MTEPRTGGILLVAVGIVTILLIAWLLATEEPDPVDYQPVYVYTDAPDTMRETCAWLSQAYSSNGAVGIRTVLKPMAIHKIPNVLACMYEMIERTQ